MPEPEPQPEPAPAPQVGQPARSAALEPLDQPPAQPLSGGLEHSEDWLALFGQLPLEGMLKSICGQLSFRKREEQTIFFDLSRQAAGILSDKYRLRFEEILNQHLKSSLSVVIDAADADNESPTRRAARLHAQAVAEAQNEIIHSEPGQALMAEFGAKLLEGSVRFREVGALQQESDIESNED